MIRSTLFVAAALALCLTACGGGGAGTPATVATQTTSPTQPSPNSAQMVPTSFTFNVSQSNASVKRPNYVGAGVKSVTITLNTVNGGAPPSGLTTSVTSNLTIPCTPCTVSGPSAPPGTDTFTITTYDATGGAGAAISTASPSLNIVVGTANTHTITLLGIPKSFSFGTIPSGTAGTASGAPLPLSVLDADGNTITGTYASAVTISDSDTSSVTQGSSLSVNGGVAATSVTSTSSSDTIALNYGGLAIPSATLSASASGATTATASFAPTLKPIVWTCTQSGGCSSSANEIDLYATSGAGSSFTWTATEIGWTNAPYSKSMTATSAAGCSTIATISGSVSSFTSTAVSMPSAGTCTFSLTDFTGGQSKTITETYTTSGIGIN